MALCPGCKNAITAVNCEHVDVNANGRIWNGNAYSCYACGTALGIEIDPMAVRNDITQELTKQTEEVKRLIRQIR
jgi:hypothetical protein